MLTTAYDFPVALKELQTIDGHPVKHSRAVVRTDTDEPISVVSDKYKIITHSQVLDKARPFLEELGTPESKFYVEGNGARFSVEYLFRNHTVDIGGRNHAALRLILRNAYRPGQSMRLQVACLVLECLNLGIMSEKTIFDLSVRHVTNDFDVEFPTPEKVLAAFTSGRRVFEKYSKMEIEPARGDEFLMENEDVIKALPQSSREGIDGRWNEGYERGERTVWALLQATTYEITHKSSRLSFTGRHNRLSRMARIFNKVFAGY